MSNSPILLLLFSIERCGRERDSVFQIRLPTAKFAEPGAARLLFGLFRPFLIVSVVCPAEALAAEFLTFVRRTHCVNRRRRVCD